MIFLKGLLFPLAVLLLVLLLLLFIFVVLLIPVAMIFVGGLIDCYCEKLLPFYVFLCVSVISGMLFCVSTPGTFLSKTADSLTVVPKSYYGFLCEEYPFVADIDKAFIAVDSSD